MITQITPPRVAFIDPRTGAVSREWYMFFLSLYDFAVSGEADINGLLQLPPTVLPDIAALEAFIASLPPSPMLEPYQDLTPPVVPVEGYQDVPPPFVGLSEYQDLTPLVVSSNGASVAPIAVTPGASPYAYVNQTSYPADMIVQGGTVSLVEFGRGATFVNVGVTAGMVRLSPFDSIRVTYTVAPTMTLVTR